MLGLSGSVRGREVLPITPTKGKKSLRRTAGAVRTRTCPQPHLFKTCSCIPIYVESLFPGSRVFAVLFKGLAKCAGLFISALPSGCFGPEGAFPTRWVCIVWSVCALGCFCCVGSWPRALAVRLVLILSGFAPLAVLVRHGLRVLAWQQGQRGDDLISASANAVSVLVQLQFCFEKSL